MIFLLCMMAVGIDWTDSKADATTDLEICGFTQMVHGGSSKSIVTQNMLVPIQMDVSFV